MPSGKALQSKIAKVLSGLNATSRTVKLRTTTVTGGNPRLGIGGTKTVVDTVVDPPPAVENAESATARLSRDGITTSGGLFQPGDLIFTFAGTISEASLRNSLILYGNDVLQITQIDPAVLGGVVVVWTVVARTIKSGD